MIVQSYYNHGFTDRVPTLGCCKSMTAALRQGCVIGKIGIYVNSAAQRWEIGLGGTDDDGKEVMLPFATCPWCGDQIEYRGPDTKPKE